MTKTNFIAKVERHTLESAYIVGIITVLILSVWSIVHIWTKRQDEGHLTNLHMTLFTILGACFALLLQSKLYFFG